MDLSLVQFLIYLFLTLQMGAWIWFQTKGGTLPHRRYYLFCFLMMLGQGATCAEALTGDIKAWGTFTSQALFFLSTAFGWFQRYRLPDPSPTQPDSHVS